MRDMAYGFFLGGCTAVLLWVANIPWWASLCGFLIAAALVLAIDKCCNTKPSGKDQGSQ